MHRVCIPAKKLNQNHNFLLFFSLVPIPAIIFLCVICGCIVILCVVYQLLKREMCCNLENNGEEKEAKTKDGYSQLESFYEFDETEGPTTDDDPQSRKSSRRSSRRSSYDLTTASQSGGELGIGDSASNFGSESIDIRISGPDEEANKNVGKILFEFNYSMANQSFSVSIVKASDIPSKARGGASAIQVRLVLTPAKNQRFKTKVRPSNNPVFNETFTFMYVDQLVINQVQLRVRLYGQERYNPARLIGEIVLPLKELDLSASKASEEKQVLKSLLARSLTVSIGYVNFIFHVSLLNIIPSVSQNMDKMCCNVPIIIPYTKYRFCDDF